jgi:uracil-DNA glycosylase
MMAKIVTAMKKTPDTAPIVFVGERPSARVYVVLGGIAMKKWFPELRCSPGQWAKGARGEEVLVTYSPEYILRLGPETPAVKKLKLAMWTSLKGVMQKS